MIVIISFVLVCFSPYVVDTRPTLLSTPVLSVLLFVFLAGFLIQRTIDRKNKLRLAASVELSRLRRICHLAEYVEKNLAWQKAVFKETIEYLKHISKNDFREYKKSHKEFRDLTHVIYSFKPQSLNERAIFEELLKITRDAAYQRQQIAQYVFSNISPYVWLVTFILLVGNIWALLVSREMSFSSHLFAFTAILGLILVFDILFQLDFLSKTERRSFQADYKQNADDLKKHRHNIKSKAKLT
jgi:hypothetical protein